MNNYQKALAVYHEVRKDLGYSTDMTPIMNHLVDDNAKVYDVIHSYDEDYKFTYDVKWDGHSIHIESGLNGWWEHKSGVNGELELSNLFNRWVIVGYDGVMSLPNAIENKLTELFPTLL